MKTFQIPAMVIALLLLLLTSCSIEKRVYMPGYHVEWNHSNQSFKQQNSKEIKKSQSIDPTVKIKNTNLYVEQNNNIENVPSKTVKETNIENTQISSIEKKEQNNSENYKSIKVKKRVILKNVHNIESNKSLNPVIIKKGKKDLTTPDSADDKDFIVALLLWVFLGTLGIHRFYLGYTGIGILYLLTAGLCGIGWLIDGILLVTGNLTPKNSNFTEE